MADMDTYDEQRGYEDERDYTRDRSRSPGPDRDGDTRIRDEPMNGRGDRDGGDKNGADSTNPGSNLFVTGIHPRLSEDEVRALFERFGAVEKCNIMRDPHTRESRGFGFVNMMSPEEADAAKEGLQGEHHEGRTLSIEKARRARPRTPTPGKYFGPPKRDDRPARRGYGGGDRYYDDRGYGGRRDDYRRGGAGGYRDRYDDRGYGSRRDDYGARGDRGGDRYSRDRYDDRRGGGHGGYGYDRAPRGPPDPVPSYSGARDPPPARDYDERPRRSYD